jgi:Tetracyclin repressor-like, C-terminal domain
VLESRTNPTPLVLAYMDSMIGMFRAGGFSIDLTHHVMHAVGSRIFGFTQELFEDLPSVDPETQATMPTEMAHSYPYITELVMAVYHDEASVVGPGCDDQFEFEFALDLLLDGIERLRQQELTSTGGQPLIVGAQALPEGAWAAAGPLDRSRSRSWARRRRSLRRPPGGFPWGLEPATSSRRGLAVADGQTASWSTPSAPAGSPPIWAAAGTLPSREFVPMVEMMGLEPTTPACKLASYERLAKPYFGRSPSSGSHHIRVSS